MTHKRSQSSRPRGSIRSRGNTFQVRVYNGVDPATGRQLYLTESCKDRDEAEATRVRLVALADGGKAAAGTWSFGDAVRQWLITRDEYVAAGELAAVSQRQSRYLAETHVIPALGAIALSSLGRELVKVAEGLYRDIGKCRIRCAGRMRMEHHPPGRRNARLVRDLTGHRCGRRCKSHVCTRASASLLRKVHSVITGTCGMLFRWGWLATDPSKRIRGPKTPLVIPKAPTTAEVVALIEAAFTQNPDWGTIVLLLSLTGARRSEITRSQLKHVDFDRNLIFLDRTKVKGTARWLALDPATMALLEALRDRITERRGALGLAPTGEEYLYSYKPDHAKPGSAGYLSKRFKDMGKSIGIDTHPHALRHYAATELIVGGIGIVDVAHRLGHKSPSTTTDIYAAWRPDADRRAAALLASGLTPPADLLADRPARDRSAEQPRRTAPTSSSASATCAAAPDGAPDASRTTLPSNESPSPAQPSGKS
jgi:integrase